ncbi:MAG: hypothetical protein M3258_05550 [Thermoproteota archaeon]|nr:hypothetical protein [Thermoproteota archaeon]
MPDYSSLANRRYRRYVIQQQKESFIQRVLVLVLHILEFLHRMLDKSHLTKRREVQKVNVE